MTGRLLHRAPMPRRRHECQPPGGWRHPSYPPGSVWQCDCGRVLVVQGGIFTLFSFREQWIWRPERRGERRRRLAAKGTGGLGSASGSAEPGGSGR